jgi:hypothetical protein
MVCMYHMVKNIYLVWGGGGGVAHLMFRLEYMLFKI